MFQSILLSLGQSINHENNLYISNYYIISMLNRHTNYGFHVLCGFPFCPLYFGYCTVCLSSIYGFQLPLWYLQPFFCLNKWLLISVEIMMYKVNIYLDALSVNKSRVHKSVHRLKWKLRSKTCQNCGGMSHFASFYDLSIGLGTCSNSVVFVCLKYQ